MVCTFERMIYKHPVTEYCVASFNTADTSVPSEARTYINKTNKKISFLATGYRIPATSAIDLELTGKWEKNKHGVQLVIEDFAEIIPATIEGIKGYLSSGLISGISDITAEKITDKFGLKSLEIIENEPLRLKEIHGLSDKKIDKIVSSYFKNKTLRNIVSYLAPFGITLNKAMKINETFGDKSMEVLNERPFELCSIAGFGFKTVDNIARKVKVKPNDKMRIKAASKYLLREAENEGHTFLSQQELRNKCFELLNESFSNVAVTPDEIRTALVEQIKTRELINNNGLIYDPYLFKCETELAKHIVLRKYLIPKKNGNIDSAIDKAQGKSGIILSGAQRDAVKMCFENSISLITGGPGTGKSTILKVIVEVYKDLYKREDILMAAPTGRAAKRMSESTGIPTARTIHSALEISGEENGSNVHIVSGLVIIDEVSMVDLKLAYNLISSIDKESIIVLVGDYDQLPSVGAGNVFHDLLKSECISSTRLDMVFRQSGTSRIPLNAEKIRMNDTKLLYGNDFNFVTTETEEETLQVIKHCYFDEVNRIGIDNVQILSPFRSRGLTCVSNINSEIRDIINPYVGDNNEIYYDGRKFRVNDKVIQTKNKDGVNNGDMGIIKSIYTNEDKEKHAIIEFSDGIVKDYSLQELDIIDLAYSTTIHKSQGGEFSTVIIPLMKSFYIMLKRNLIYTAITRAKKKVVLIGQKQALMMAIHKTDSEKRNSLLGERIKSMVERIEKGAS